MASIGIRELRQQASKYIRRVEGGETVEVTDHGRPVALLVPIPQQTVRERLIASGRLRPAAGKRDLLDIKPLPAVEGQPLLSEILAEMREDER
jgi:prevent-host-death family protein